jgi:hypothetical protein
LSSCQNVYAWLVKGYHAINKPSLVKKVGLSHFYFFTYLHPCLQAFELCKAGSEFNLSFDSITSREALILLRNIQKNDTHLWSKITASQYDSAGGVEPDPILDETEDETEITEDNVEVPVDTVVEYMCLGGIVVPGGYAVGSDGALQVANTSEEYECEELGEENCEVLEYGQGKRRAISNQQYKEFWRH